MFAPPSPNSGEKPEATCPFKAHARSIQTTGFGPWSRMVDESILNSEGNHPKSELLHREEGIKFAALMRQMAPPSLVATYFQTRTGHYPNAELMDPEQLADDLGSILRYGVTQNRLGDAIGFLENCTNPATLLLAARYFTRSLNQYSLDLSHALEGDRIRTDVQSLGMHFLSRNLQVALPFMLYKTLLTTHGGAADASLVDSKVMGATLKYIQSIGGFAIIRNGETFECPMSGYLFELLVRFDAFEPLLAATVRADVALDQGKADMVSPLIEHSINRRSVAVIAHELLDGSVEVKDYRSANA